MPNILLFSDARQAYEAYEAQEAYEDRAPKADGGYRAADTQGKRVNTP